MITTTRTQIVKEPTENDVKAGRGNGTNRHPGNLYFRTIVEKQKSAYTSSTGDDEKRKIISDIIEQIESLNGRFLKEDTNSSGLWYVMDYRQKVRKIGQALREKQIKMRIRGEGDTNENIDIPSDNDNSIPPTSNNKRKCDEAEGEKNLPIKKCARNNTTEIDNRENNGPQAAVGQNVETQHAVDKCSHDHNPRVHIDNNLLRINEQYGKLPRRNAALVKNQNLIDLLISILADADNEDGVTPVTATG